MKTKIFHEPLYRAKVLLALSTQEEYKKLLWDRYLTTTNLTNENIACHVYLDTKDIDTLWIGPESETEDLMHECVHLVTSIFKIRGISCDLEKEDEHFAYYLTYWFSKFKKFMEKQNEIDKS